MTPGSLTQADKKHLLVLARQALEKAVMGEEISPIDHIVLSPCLQEVGASFVTLTRSGELRGCIGALDASLPLAEDVCFHAAAAGLRDYRFPPVAAEELPHLQIEISYLTPPVLLEYQEPDELPRLLRPLVDGVVIYYEERRATFLPQVWEKLPDPEMFLSYLCKKLGCLPDLWRCEPLQVWVYQVEKFTE